MRLDVADLAKIKCIARRLRVRDSDIIRFALKQALGQLSPLADPRIKGRELVPMLLEPGAGIVRHFDLDADKLDSVVNAGIEDPAQRVATQDLHLLAMTTAMSPPLSPNPTQAEASSATDATGAPARVERRINPTRRYLFEKYLYRALD